MPGLTGVANPSFVYNESLGPTSGMEMAVRVQDQLSQPQAMAVAVASSSSMSTVNGPNAKPRIVVHVENANKSYGTGPKAKHVLKDLCITVEEHTIYGILGASGCGKTTILTSIVALRKLDSGSILVCGQPTGTVGSGIPGKKVGYMPQELALNGEFTIVEVLAYFGRIFGMDRSEIKNRTKYLLMLLSLGGFNQQIGNLSDGQKRRVSLAVSLIHEPDLLVLDEPTVGCDPLLRDSIWTYLRDLVATKAATVVVSTHYIEEMRLAHRIGIMRSGRLLCEASPTDLLRIFNEDLLDSVVVKLCHQDERTGGAGAGIPEFRQRQGKGPNANALTATNVAVDWSLSTRPTAGARARHRKPFESTAAVLHRMHGLLIKDFVVVLRNWWVVLILSLAPALTVALICIGVSSSPKGLKMGYVNYETDNCSASTFNLSQLAPGGCLAAPPPNLDLSCIFLAALDSEALELIPFESEDDAEDEALRRGIWGYFWFTENFSEAFWRRFVLNDLNGSDSDNDSEDVSDNDNVTFADSEINVRLDTSGSKQTTQFLKGKFMEALQKLTSGIYEACGLDGTENESPITLGPPIFAFGGRSLRVSRVSYVSIGCLLGVLFFMCALQCGLTYIAERKDGMLNRTLVTGVTNLEIILSHFLIQLFVIALSQILVCFFLAFVIFGAESEGSMLLSFLLVFLNCITGMSIGFLLATFCNQEKYAILLALALVMPNFILSGLLWPAESLPEVLGYIGAILPSSVTGSGARSITTRGLDASYEVVWLGFVATAAWTGGTWLVIILWQKFGARKD